jgi:hypothetical protein
LQEHFGDRYTLIEEFLKVQVKVLDFTDADKTWLRNFFDSTLDPNILIALTEWFDFIEVVSLGDIPRVTAVRKDRDIYPRGLRYDGRIKYDHGKEIRFDGSGTYNGFLNYSNVVGMKGTVSEYIKSAEPYNGVRTYGGEIIYSGETEVWAPEDIQNPATYGGGKDDDTLAIHGKQQVADKAEVYPTYDGRFTYRGSITHGGTQPSMIDEALVKMVQRMAITDAIESTDASSVVSIHKKDQDIYPSGLRYDGRIRYDHGIIPCFDGKNTYNGEVPYQNVISKKGTIIDEEHGDIPNPATYKSDSGKQDTLKAAGNMQLQDQVAIHPTYNGLRSFGGVINYGDTLPLANDAMNIKINRQCRYDGKQTYNGKINAGMNEESI